MTKKEIREKLVCSKIYVNGKFKALQKKLLSFGCKWPATERFINSDMPFIYIDQNLTLYYGSNMTEFSSKSYMEINVEEILNWETEEKFKPFDRVLVRDSLVESWNASFYSHKSKASDEHCTIDDCYKYCIPYEGNEHLVGTNLNS